MLTILLHLITCILSLGKWTCRKAPETRGAARLLLLWIEDFRLPSHSFNAHELWCCLCLPFARPWSPLTLQPGRAVSRASGINMAKKKNRSQRMTSFFGTPAALSSHQPVSNTFFSFFLTKSRYILEIYLPSVLWIEESTIILFMLFQLSLQV